MAGLKPITLYTHASGPNPWKVAIILEELSIPYVSNFVDFSKIKSEPYVLINPNGRVPAITDPNTGITLWESGAIIQYLVDKYDPESLISSRSFPDKYLEQQWLAFQISGQGPYFGQAAWFNLFHHEALPSAKERYNKEMERVIGVLDSWLAKTQKPFLVGDKCTYADLSFVTWSSIVSYINVDGTVLGDESKFPHYRKWLATLLERPAVKKVMAEKAAKAGGH